MEAGSGFWLHLAAAKQMVVRLSSHSSAYEAALRSENIPEDYSNSLRICILEIESALCALLIEVGATLQIEMPNGQPWRKRLLDGLGVHSSALRMAVGASVAVADSDGWLSHLEAVWAGSLQLDLRRETALVTFAPGSDGIPLLDVRTKSGESLSMLAPLLVEEASGSDGSRIGYYVAVFPEGREAVAFVDRCVRGAEHLASAVRKNLAAAGS